jgi:hypothetical protein
VKKRTWGALLDPSLILHGTLCKQMASALSNVHHTSLEMETFLTVPLINVQVVVSLKCLKLRNCRWIKGRTVLCSQLHPSWGFLGPHQPHSRDHESSFAGSCRWYRITSDNFLTSSATFNVFSDFDEYQGGVYQVIHLRTVLWMTRQKYQSGDYEGIHSVKVIGYGIENGTDYWLVQKYVSEVLHS